MKLGDAIPAYQAYNTLLQSQRNSIFSNLRDAQKKAENGSPEWTKKAAELQLSYDQISDQCEKYQDILNSLHDQWNFAAEAESNRAMSDPETGYGATMGKIMTTVARMCAGDKVPASDEKKVMEYDSKLYARVKQCQMQMAAMKKRQKEYESLWDEEGGEYDPEGVANNTEAAGELPAIPSEIPSDSASATLESAELSE